MKRRTSVVWAALLKNHHREEVRYMKWLIIVLVTSLMVLSTGAPTFAQPPEPRIPFDKIISKLLCTADNVFEWPDDVIIGQGLGIEVLEASDNPVGDNLRQAVVILSYGNNEISLAILYADDDTSESLTCGDPIVAGSIVDH